MINSGFNCTPSCRPPCLKGTGCFVESTESVCSQLALTCETLQHGTSPAAEIGCCQALTLLLVLQVLVLENVRFYKEETKNDAEFAKKVSAAALDLLLLSKICTSSWSKFLQSLSWHCRPGVIFK